MQTRRTIITGALATFAARARAQEKADGEDFKVTLLGTGTPVPSLKRFGPSSLVQAGGETFMIDCGRGATQRLWQLGVRFSTVSSLFLTHLHSDHIVGIPDLWATGWLNQAWGGRREPLAVYGPPGTRNMMENMRAGVVEQALRAQHVRGDELRGALHDRRHHLPGRRRQFDYRDQSGRPEHRVGRSDRRRSRVFYGARVDVGRDGLDGRCGYRRHYVR